MLWLEAGKQGRHAAFFFSCSRTNILWERFETPICQEEQEARGISDLSTRRTPNAAPDYGWCWCPRNFGGGGTFRCDCSEREGASAAPVPPAGEQPHTRVRGQDRPVLLVGRAWLPTCRESAVDSLRRPAALVPFTWCTVAEMEVVVGELKPNRQSCICQLIYSFA